MKIKLFFIFLFLSQILFAKDFYYVGFYPEISPIEKFVNNFVNYFNKVNSKSELIKIKENDFFKNPIEILDACQSNILQLIIVPGYVVNNRYSNKFDELYIGNKNVNFLMIPFREKLINYGLFLLDLFYAGNYQVYSNLRVDKKKFYKKIVFGIPFSSFRIKKIFKNYQGVIYIEKKEDFLRLLSANIINSVILTPYQFYTMNLNLKYEFRAKIFSEYFFILVNNAFWTGLDFNQKSILWSYITNYHEKFRIDFTKFNVLIENSIFKKLKVIK